MARRKRCPAVVPLGRDNTGTGPQELVRDAESGVLVARHGDDCGTAEAMQHRGVEKHGTYVDGRGAVPRRTIDVLRRLYLDGRLQDDAYAAGCRWRDAFDRAGFAGMRIVQLDRAGSGAAGHADLADSTIAARREVLDAIAAMGGDRSPLGRALWWCVGLRWGLAQFAGDGHAAQQSVSRSQRAVVSALVVAACDGLAIHYRHGRRAKPVDRVES